MGKFIGVIAAALDRADGEFVQATEILDFGGETWVYYCRPQLGEPQPGWTDLAADTLRISLNPPPARHDQVEWRPSITCDQAGTCEYIAEAFGVEQGNNLFHLALPPGYLPVPTSWDVPPLYGHADEGRFVIGWGGDQEKDIWPTFRIEPAAPEVFAPQAETIGREIERKSRQRRQAVLNPRGADDGPGQAKLLNELDQRLNLEDVRTLLFELGIDYDDLAGETKKGKLREMLLYLGRQGQTPRLVTHLRDNYPNVLRD